MLWPFSSRTSQGHVISLETLLLYRHLYNALMYFSRMPFCIISSHFFSFPWQTAFGDFGNTKIAISAQYENVSVWKYNDINVVKSFSYYANIFGSIKQASLLKSTSITYPRASPEFGHCLNSVLVITVSKTFYLLVIWFIIVYLFYWFFFQCIL